jgi:hypothetical protein
MTPRTIGGTQTYRAPCSTNRSAAGRARHLVVLTVLTIFPSATIVCDGLAWAEPRGKLSHEDLEIDAALCEDARRAGTWDTAWAATFAIAAVGSAGIATFAPHTWLDSNRRAGLYVTAAKATIGAVDRLVDPLHFDTVGLCGDPNEASSSARNALLLKAAHRERNGLALELLGGVALNTAGLLYLGYGRGSWQTAWISFGVGTAVGVASALTAPVQAWLLNRRRLDSKRSVAMISAIVSDRPGMALVGTW